QSAPPSPWPLPPATTDSLPEVMTTAELEQLVRGLPETPDLAALSAWFEEIREDYSDLPPEQARRGGQAQEAEKERTLRDIRARSTHAEARAELLSRLELGQPFSLLLRTFEREVARGRSRMTGGAMMFWPTDRTLDSHVAQGPPLPLIGVANPRDPFPSPDCLLLEAGTEWRRIVVSVIARAEAIFVICDRLTPGVNTEFIAID